MTTTKTIRPEIEEALAFAALPLELALDES